MKSTTCSLADVTVMVATAISALCKIKQLLKITNSMPFTEAGGQGKHAKITWDTSQGRARGYSPSIGTC